MQCRQCRAAWLQEVIWWSGHLRRATTVRLAQNRWCGVSPQSTQQGQPVAGVCDRFPVTLVLRPSTRRSPVDSFHLAGGTQRPWRSDADWHACAQKAARSPSARSRNAHRQRASSRPRLAQGAPDLPAHQRRKGGLGYEAGQAEPFVARGGGDVSEEVFASPTERF
jgi:hypothetical protein